MTGPGHAEEEAFQREAEEKAVAGQAGAEARSVREPEEGAGLGLPHIWKEGCARFTSGRRGRGWRPRADARGRPRRGFPTPAPYIWKGWGRMESWGRGIPPAPTGRHPRRSLEEEECLPPRISGRVLGRVGGRARSQKKCGGVGRSQADPGGGLLAPENWPALASPAPPRRASRWAAIQFQQPQREPREAGGADRHLGRGVCDPSHPQAQPATFPRAGPARL